VDIRIQPHETFDKIYQDHFMMLESEKPWWLGEDKLHYSHKGRLHEKRSLKNITSIQSFLILEN
jgi:hypothetical protein